MTGILSLFLFANSPLPAEPPVAVSTASDPLVESLPILQAKYIHFASLQVKEGDRLSDLISRSKGEVSLLPSESASSSRPMVITLLPGSIIYWRVGSFKPEKSWSDLSAQLDQWTQQGAIGMVLDFRSNLAPDDYFGAAQLAAFFNRNQIAPFKILDDSLNAALVIPFHPAQPFHQPVVILVDHGTTGAAEALAESLKRQGALVIGQETSGMGAMFGEERLTSGQVLRYMTASVALADGTDLWHHPVTPDISMAIDDKTEASALDLIAQGQVTDVIGESAERHRLSEAALVQGENPEEEAYLEAHEKKPVLLSLPVIHDAVLITALDSIKVIGLSQKQTASTVPADLHPSSATSVQ